MDNYFCSFLDQLENCVENFTKSYHEDSDLTIDLESMVRNKMGKTSKTKTLPIRQNSINKQVQSNNTNYGPHNRLELVEREEFRVPQTTDLNLIQLEFISKELANNSVYGEHLVSIMSNGIRNSLGPSFYKLFMANQISDTNIVPIVRMNSSNTPYIEFLLKSSLSDESPFSQLSSYAISEMTLSKFITDKIREIVIKREKQQNLTHQQQNHNQRQHEFQQNQQHQQRQGMICSTPIRGSRPNTAKRTVSQLAERVSDKPLPNKKPLPISNSLNIIPKTKTPVSIPEPTNEKKVSNQESLNSKSLPQTEQHGQLAAEKKRPVSLGRASNVDLNSSIRTPLLRACKVNRQKYTP